MPDLTLETSRSIEAVDVTDMVAGHELTGNFVWIGCPHTTAAILLCEADADMLADLERLAADLLAPFEPFRHHRNDNPNAAAHLFSSLMGAGLVVPVTEGQLEIGPYQRLLFLELDGPRPRTLRLRTW